MAARDALERLQAVRQDLTIKIQRELADVERETLDVINLPADLVNEYRDNGVQVYLDIQNVLKEEVNQLRNQLADTVDAQIQAQIIERLENLQQLIIEAEARAQEVIETTSSTVDAQINAQKEALDDYIDRVQREIEDLDDGLLVIPTEIVDVIETIVGVNKQEVPDWKKPGSRQVTRPFRSQARVFKPRDVGRIARYARSDGGSEISICAWLARNGIVCGVTVEQCQQVKAILDEALDYLGEETNTQTIVELLAALGGSVTVVIDPPDPGEPEDVTLLGSVNSMFAFLLNKGRRAITGLFTAVNVAIFLTRIDNLGAELAKLLANLDTLRKVLQEVSQFVDASCRTIELADGNDNEVNTNGNS